MEQLRDDEFAILDYLDDKTRELYDDATYEMRLGFRGGQARTAMIVDVITTLARALGDTARYREALVYYDNLGLGKDAEGRTLADYVLKGEERDDKVDR